MPSAGCIRLILITMAQITAFHWHTEAFTLELAHTSGLGSSPPYLACGDLPKGYDDLSVIRFYERLGSF